MEIETTREYRQKVLEALEEARKRFSGSNGEFAKKYGLHPSIYSEIVKGKITCLLYTSHLRASVKYRLKTL